LTAITEDTAGMLLHENATVRLMAQKILWTLGNCRWPEIRRERVRAYLREAVEELAQTRRAKCR
jgi:hypothetical protein